MSRKAILPSSAALYCDLCQRHCGNISMLPHFVLLPTFLSLELSSNGIDLLMFPLTMDVLGQNYTLEGLVRCTSHHFTVAIKADTQWVYIDEICVSVKAYTSFQDLLPHHSSGWFFAIFKKSSVRVANDTIQTSFPASQTPTQNLDDFPVSTLPRDPLSIENITTCSVTITKSSTVALNAICYSVLKPCVYWKTGTSDAIVKCGSSLFSDTIKRQPNPRELFQNINIYGAHIDVNGVSTTTRTLVRSSSKPLENLNPLMIIEQLMMPQALMPLMTTQQHLMTKQHLTTTRLKPYNDNATTDDTSFKHIPSSCLFHIYSCFDNNIVLNNIVVFKLLKHCVAFMSQDFMALLNIMISSHKRKTNSVFLIAKIGFDALLKHHPNSPSMFKITRKEEIRTWEGDPPPKVIFTHPLFHHKPSESFFKTQE